MQLMNCSFSSADPSALSANWSWSHGKTWTHSQHMPGCIELRGASPDLWVCECTNFLNFLLPCQQQQQQKLCESNTAANKKISSAADDADDDL